MAFLVSSPATYAGAPRRAAQRSPGAISRPSPRFTARRPVLACARPKRPSGGDGAGGSERAPEATRFEAETTEVVVRCLTARAVQHMLLQLQDVDGHAAAWLNKFSASHPPLDGDKFISELMLTPPVAVLDPRNPGRSHVISPTQLATGVLAVREELSRHVAKALPTTMAAGNVAVMRRHLEEHTYVSGSSQDAPRASCGDHRRRNNKWQRLARGAEM